MKTYLSILPGTYPSKGHRCPGSRSRNSIQPGKTESAGQMRNRHGKQDSSCILGELSVTSKNSKEQEMP